MDARNLLKCLLPVGLLSITMPRAEAQVVYVGQGTLPSTSYTVNVKATFTLVTAGTGFGLQIAEQNLTAADRTFSNGDVLTGVFFDTTNHYSGQLAGTTLGQALASGSSVVNQDGTLYTSQVLSVYGIGDVSATSISGVPAHDYLIDSNPYGGYSIAGSSGHSDQYGMVPTSAVNASPAVNANKWPYVDNSVIFTTQQIYGLTALSQVDDVYFAFGTAAQNGTQNAQVHGALQSSPEPSALAGLVSLGLAAACFLQRRKK